MTEGSGQPDVASPRDVGSLSGHVALITGSTRGIGRAIAERFAAEGAPVVVNGRDAAAARSVAATLDGAIGIAGDVSDLASVQAMCRRAEELGPVDILVHNAGISSRRAITRMTDDEWFESLAVNLTGSMYTIRELVPGMKARG
jgi:NAD(P)-dependent dehydrogenase (short-subunit alcohol dehydrogenase family)